MCTYCDSNPDLPHTEVAKLAGVNESTIRRHRAKKLNATDPFFADVPTSAITSRGRSYRLADGSWEKITFSPAKAALADALTYDDIEAAIEGFKATPPPANPLPHTEILNVADAQIGKGGESGGGSLDTVRRVLTSFERFARRCEVSKPEAIVIVDTGDIIENLFNKTAKQLSTNDMDLALQIRAARRLMAEGIKKIAHLAPKVYYVAVPSNHGQVRVSAKEAVGAVDNDFGVEISYQIEDVLTESEAFRHIEFIRPVRHSETAVLETSGTKIAWHHGHRSKPDKPDEWVKGQDHGRLPGWDADIWILAHYHTFGVVQAGAASRWIVQCSASEPSSDWFALNTGKRSARGCTALSVSGGMWSHLEIL